MTHYQQLFDIAADNYGIVTAKRPNSARNLDNAIRRAAGQENRLANLYADQLAQNVLPTVDEAVAWANALIDGIASS